MKKRCRHHSRCCFYYRFYYFFLIHARETDSRTCSRNYKISPKSSSLEDSGKSCAIHNLNRYNRQHIASFAIAFQVQEEKKTKVGRASFTPFKSLDLYLLHVPTLPAAGPDTAAAGITFSVRSALLLFLDPAGTEQEDKPRLDRQHLKATPDCNRDPTKTCLGKVEWTFLCTFPRQAVI